LGPHVQISEMTAVIPLAPFPPLHWWILALDGAVLDINAPFQKQTHRNRIKIAGPQGEQRITFATQSSPIESVSPLLSAHQKPQHSWRSIQTAYGNSPFFEHFAEDLNALWLGHLPREHEDAKPLSDWCWASIEWVAETCNWPLPSQASCAPAFQDSELDLREKRRLSGHGWTFHRYPQLFESKFGFIPGCSVLDAFFVLGPHELSRCLKELVSLDKS